jgi:alkylation response protein AidB-like acyl-CoA dehydrogenase
MPLFPAKRYPHAHASHHGYLYVLRQWPGIGFKELTCYNKKAMNFDFTEREKDIRDRVRDVFDAASKAALMQLEQGDDIPVKSEVLRWMKALGQTGYLSLGLESGKDSTELLAAQETLAAISPSLFLSAETSVRIFGRLIAVYGTPEQQTEFLPALTEGRLIGAVALSEGGMSIENNPLTTTGRMVGGGFKVSGSKTYVVNGPIADWIAVAGTEEERIAFFLIQKGSEGLSTGERLATLGYSGVAASAISVENCPVPPRYVIGDCKGKEPLRSIRAWEDGILTAGSLGLMQRCYETAVPYAKSHESGGRPIIRYQEVGFKLAEMLTLMQTAQLLAYRAAWMAEVGDREAPVLAHCAKVFCAESAEAVASDALQILGGHGYIRGNLAEEGYRNAKYLQIAGTSTEISRMKIGDGILEGE